MFNDTVGRRIMCKLVAFQEKDPGFALQSILGLEMNINKEEFSLGGSYTDQRN